MYTVEIVKSVLKEIKDLPKKDILKILKKLHFLEKNPYQLKLKKLKKEENIFRVRCGKYRILFEINEDKKLIIITRIRHRKKVY